MQVVMNLFVRAKSIAISPSSYLLRPLSVSHVKYEQNKDSKIYEFDESRAIEVYKGPLSSQIRNVKLLSLVTSIGGLMAQPVIFEKANELNTHMAVLIGVTTFVGFFTFVTPFLLHLITKKYVTSIHFDPKSESYQAKTYTLFLADKLLIFKPEDVHVPDVLGMFTSFHAKGVPIFVEASNFEDISHYQKIMGYDKPLDFKLSSSNEK